MNAKHAFHPEYITDANGHRKAVVLPIEEYESLIEDLADLAIVAERRGEPTHSQEAVMDELERDGLLTGLNGGSLRARRSSTSSAAPFGAF